MCINWVLEYCGLEGGTRNGIGEVEVRSWDGRLSV